MADVDAVDARRAALQEAVREAAGREAAVEGDDAGHVHAERVQRRLQLQASPARARFRCCGAASQQNEYSLTKCLFAELRYQQGKSRYAP